MPRCGGAGRGGRADAAAPAAPAGRGGRRRAVRREGNAIASASVDVVRGGVDGGGGVVWRVCGGGDWFVDAIANRVKRRGRVNENFAVTNTAQPLGGPMGFLN